MTITIKYNLGYYFLIHIFGVSCDILIGTLLIGNIGELDCKARSRKRVPPVTWAGYTLGESILGRYGPRWRPPYDAAMLDCLTMT